MSEPKKIRVGVLGAGRGGSMISYCNAANNAEVVAICDRSVEQLNIQKEVTAGHDIAFYEDFDEFIKHDMDAVVLANYANQHAPFAIKAMRAGKHVFSECLPVQSMKEAVELVETVEETDKVYAYGENYCYAAAPYEMKKRYQEGAIGEFEYGECEYIHNCESVWPDIAYGDPDHWRNNMYATFYCTHSIGPMLHMTGLRPVSVIGFEGTKTERNMRTGSKGGSFGIEMITLENGGILKSVHGGLYHNSIWYAAYGSKGSMESAREAANNDGWYTLHVRYDEYSGQYQPKEETYHPSELRDYHGGGDYLSMWHFIEYLRGNKDAEIIDVYEALDMGLPGILAYRSVLNGNRLERIPNLRNKEEREPYRNDTACTDPEYAGDQLLPCCSLGNPDIPAEVYAAQKAEFERHLADENSNMKHIAEERVKQAEANAKRMKS